MGRTTSRARQRILLAVAGGSASGKSSVVAYLRSALAPVPAAALPHDAYYRDLSHLTPLDRSRVNVDEPGSLETDLFVRHLEALLRGETIRRPRYDFVTQTRHPERLSVDSAPVVVADGLFVLAEPRIRELAALRVFVATTPEQRLARRIARDGAERGRDAAQVEAQHVARVEPMHRKYVEPSRRWADVVIPGGARNRAAIDRLAARVRSLIDRG